MPEPRKEADDRSPWRGQDRSERNQWYRLSGLGFEFIAAIIGMGALGWYLDRVFETSPWLMLAGGLTGFAAGLWILIKAGMKMFHD